MKDFAEKHGGQITNESITLDKPSTFSLEIDADTIDMKYPHFQQEQYNKLPSEDKLSHAFAKFVHNEMGFTDGHPDVRSNHKMIIVGIDEDHEMPSGTYLDVVREGDELKISLVHEIYTKEDADFSGLKPGDPLYELNL